MYYSAGSPSEVARGLNWTGRSAMQVRAVHAGRPRCGRLTPCVPPARGVRRCQYWCSRRMTSGKPHAESSSVFSQFTWSLHSRKVQCMFKPCKNQSVFKCKIELFSRLTELLLVRTTRYTLASGWNRLPLPFDQVLHLFFFFFFNIYFCIWLC